MVRGPVFLGWLAINPFTCCFLINERFDFEFFLFKKPDIVPMEKAIDHVMSYVSPGKDPNFTNWSEEGEEACRLILEKLRNGKLPSWEKKIEVDYVGGNQAHTPHSTDSDIRLTKNEWRYRELIPLTASIDRDNKAQTTSFGSGEDHIQLTALKTDFNKVKKLWRVENA